MNKAIIAVVIVLTIAAVGTATFAVQAHAAANVNFGNAVSAAAKQGPSTGGSFGSSTSTSSPKTSSSD